MNVVFANMNTPQSQELEQMGDFSTIFGVIAGIGFVIALTLVILTFMAAKYLGETKNPTFIVVVLILNCFTGILGILLGVFTILEINKPHVKVLFDQNK